MNFVWGLVAAVALQDSDRVLRDAFDKTHQVDGLGIQGTLRKAETEGLPQGGPGGMMFMGGPGLEGDLTGKLSNKDAVLEVANKDKGTTLEIFKKGEKSVKRSTWVKEPMGAGPGIEMLLKLTDFDALAHAARDGKFEESVEETSEGKAVLRIRGTMPEKLLESGDSDRPGPGMMMGGKVKKITLDARIEKESGLVQSLSFTIERELDFGGMAVKRFGGEGGEDMEPPEMPKIQIKQTIEYKVSGTGDDHKPKFPESIEKSLQH
jgi:hypothetical protein